MTSVAIPAKSFLMTPDPYHTPGYGGYCPQFKYRIGNTFGHTTMKLLHDPNVSSSGNLVLTAMTPVRTEADNIGEKRVQLLKTRKQSLGDQKLVEQMVPGYKGFIPKSQHYFGKRYAENCTNAISDFENDQRKQNQKIQDLKVADALQSGRIVQGSTLPEIHTKNKTPLKRIAKEAQPYVSKSAPCYPLSPYHMDNYNPNKRFMSGYTGFVPRSRALLGLGYPLITHNAINEFTDEYKEYKLRASVPISIYRDKTNYVDTNVIFPQKSGLVPHYTGHIPGQKFRHGHTFGDSTVDSKRTAAVAAANVY